MNKQQPIGVIDSGVGGLTVLRRLQELMPHEHFIFWAIRSIRPMATGPVRISSVS